MCHYTKYSNIFTSYVYLEPISKNDLFIEAFVILLSMSDIELAFLQRACVKSQRRALSPLRRSK